MSENTVASVPRYVLDWDSLQSNVPACLRDRARWVCWRYENRGKKVTKVPLNPRTGGMASSTDPATWGTFDEALEAARTGGLAGIGFVFSADGPFAGIDLDNCIDATTGAIKPWAAELLQELDSYSEISPSGLGVKVIVEAIKPGPRCKRAFEDGAVEIYDRGRFFTITGNRLATAPAAIHSRQKELGSVYVRVFGAEQPVAAPDSPPAAAPPAPGLTDDQILEKASRSRKSGAKFAALWAGNWKEHFDSPSEADSSLVFTIAFYTKDAIQIDRVFRRSALMRPKWDELHGDKTYGQMTIDKALELVTGQYRPRRPTRRDACNDADADAATDDARIPPLGQREPETGRIVLSPRRTLPTAEAFVGEFYAHPDGRTLHSFAGVLMAWRGNRYVPIEDEGVRQQLQPWLHSALRPHLNRQNQQIELIDFESNPGTIKAAAESIHTYAHCPATLTPACWLDERKDGPNPSDLLPFPAGTLDLATGKILAPTPMLFNVNAIDFNYDPNPAAPERWMRFLEQLFGDDLDSVQLLQEWMGYCLVADTSQQKMLLIVGPKRSGKGTIGRVVARLVGSGNVVGPTTSSLAGNFGLQPLIGKSLAIVSDARFGGENVGVVVERLLCISGEDALTVDRKFLGSVTTKLPTRFMFLTNELPRMNDASGALAGRFVILRLTKSFYGEEDVTLTQQLLSELPGVLGWSIKGLIRLRQRGYFMQPQAVSDAVQEMEDLASPVLAFVRECCEVGAGLRVWMDALYSAWQGWCTREGRTLISNRQTFGRDLAAAVPGIHCRRHSAQGRFYEGIALQAVPN